MDWRFVASLIQLDALRMQSPWRFGTGGLPPRMPSSLGSPPRLPSYPSPVGLFPFLQLPPPPPPSTPFASNPPSSIDASGISGAFHPKKPGRWCAAHVRIAWEIHINQQIQPTRQHHHHHQHHHQQPPPPPSAAAAPPPQGGDQGLLLGAQKGSGGNGQRRPSLGPSPWTTTTGATGAGAPPNGAGGGGLNGGLSLGPSSGGGADNNGGGMRSTSPPPPTTTTGGLQDGTASAATAGLGSGVFSRPNSRSNAAHGPTIQSPVLNFPSFLGPLNERSFAAQLEAIYKYGMAGSSLTGLSPFRGISSFANPGYGFLSSGFDGYFGGGGGGVGGIAGAGSLFSPSDVGFSLSSPGGGGGSVVPGAASASSELSRLGRSAVASSSFGGTRPWQDPTSGRGTTAGGEGKGPPVESNENRKSEHCHRNHKHSRDHDASSYRRSSGSRDSSSRDSNSPASGVKSLLSRDRSRSPVSRNRPDSTVRLVDHPTNRQQPSTDHPRPHPHPHHDDDWKKKSTTPEHSCSSVWGDRSGSTAAESGLNPDQGLLGGYYAAARRDPLSAAAAAMVDPVLVGLYSGLAGLAGGHQSYLGPFGFYGRGVQPLPEPSRDPEPDGSPPDRSGFSAGPAAAAGEAAVKDGRSPPAVERERERERKRKDRSGASSVDGKDSKRISGSSKKQFLPDPVPVKPDQAESGKPVAPPCGEETTNHHHHHHLQKGLSPSSTVETSSAPALTLADAAKATATGTGTGHHAKTSESGTSTAPDPAGALPETGTAAPTSSSSSSSSSSSFSTSGNVTPDSSSCEVQRQRSEKTGSPVVEEEEEEEEAEEQSVPVHETLVPLQERC